MSSYDTDKAVYSIISPRTDTGVDFLFYGNYSWLNTISTEYLKFTLNVTQAGTYNMEVYGYCSAYYITYSQLFLDGNNLTDPFLVPVGNAFKISNIYLPKGIHILKWLLENSDYTPNHDPNWALMPNFDSMLFTQVTPDPQYTCTPMTSCVSKGYTCGTLYDGCQMVQCGSCAGSCLDGKCTTCSQVTCAGAGYSCGQLFDGCHNINCGPCTPPHYCNATGICKIGKLCVMC